MKHILTVCMKEDNPNLPAWRLEEFTRSLAYFFCELQIKLSGHKSDSQRLKHFREMTNVNYQDKDEYVIRPKVVEKISYVWVGVGETFLYIW